MSQLFKETTVSIGDISPGQKGVVVDFMYDTLKASEIATYKDGNGNTIPCVNFGCGCTASPQILPDRLRVLYNDGGNNVGNIGKSLSVFYITGNEPIRIKNERGIEITNPKLASTSLYFNANVVKR